VWVACADESKASERASVKLRVEKDGVLQCRCPPHGERSITWLAYTVGIRKRLNGNEVRPQVPSGENVRHEGVTACC